MDIAQFPSSICDQAYWSNFRNDKLTTYMITLSSCGYGSVSIIHLWPSTGATLEYPARLEHIVSTILIQVSFHLNICLSRICLCLVIIMILNEVYSWFDDAKFIASNTCSRMQVIFNTSQLLPMSCLDDANSRWPTLYIGQITRYLDCYGGENQKFQLLVSLDQHHPYL